MGYYLLENQNPNAPVRSDGRRYWGYPTRLKKIRLIVIHTPEWLEDFEGDDYAAENVAKYFSTTARPSSAHACIDSDSTVECLPDEATGFHVIGHNSEALGAEIGYRADSWAKMPDQRKRAVVARTAMWAREKALTHRIPFRRLTDAQVAAGWAGFASHAQLDPARRTDPGKDFPWGDFMSLAATGAPLPTPPFPDFSTPAPRPPIQEDDSMWTLFKTADDARIFAVGPTTFLINPTPLRELLALSLLRNAGSVSVVSAATLAQLTNGLSAV